jgi:hypothetical protein
LLKQIIKQTVDLQGFRVHTVTKHPDGLIAEIRPDASHRVRCGSCGHPAVYRDQREVRFFRHVPLWNISVWFKYEPCRVSYILPKGALQRGNPYSLKNVALGPSESTRPTWWTLRFVTNSALLLRRDRYIYLRRFRQILSLSMPLLRGKKKDTVAFSPTFHVYVFLISTALRPASFSTVMFHKFISICNERNG